MNDRLINFSSILPSLLNTQLFNLQQACFLLVWAVFLFATMPTEAQSTLNTPAAFEQRVGSSAKSSERQILMTDPFSDSNKSIFQKYVDACNRKLANNLEQEDRLRAIVDACDLYVLMQQNPDVRDSETLTGKKRKLLAILRRELKELQSEKRKSTGKQNGGSDRTSNAKSGATNLDPSGFDPHGFELHGFDPPGLDLDPLGESVAQAPAPTATQKTAAIRTATHQFDNSAGDNLAKGELQRELLSLHSESMDWELAYRLSSGPSQMLVRAGGATVGDPTELITLIQTTVTPNVWDVNGGPATIGYYQRVHALVVRAPWSTHLGTQDLLKRFRE